MSNSEFEGEHLLFVTQKVKDIKVADTNEELLREMGKLRRGLRKHSYIPGEKIPVELTPTKVNDDGVFLADLPGDQLSSDLDATIHVKFPLNLTGYQGRMDVEEVFSSAEGVKIGDGGNIQNGAVNTMLAVVGADLKGLLQQHGSDFRLSIASSSDPLARMDQDTASRLENSFKWHELDLDDRFAIQVPWSDAGETGTLAITSEPKRTSKSLERLIRDNADFKEAFQQATCFVSSDPLFDQLERHAQAPYTYIINASSAFRSLVASDSYNRSVVLPMNNGEAADVSRLLFQRKYSAELEEIKRPKIPSPLTPDGEQINPESLAELDESINQIRSFVPLKRNPERIGIACPITFGAKGGLIVGTGQEEIACFTTTPHPDKETRLLEEFGNDERIDMSKKHDVGAGDSAATMITLFESIDPQIFIEPHLEPRERDDKLLRDLASTIYVNTLARIGGNFLIRTQDTNWSNIKPDRFRALFEEAAKEALDIARKAVQNFADGPSLNEIERWGIQVLTWKLGSVVHSNHENHTH